MKFRILVNLIEKLLGMRETGDNPRADMYLPDKLLAFGLTLIGGGIGLSIAYAFVLEIWMIIAGPLATLIGVLAVLCWKNQTIHIISNEKFEYTTFLGNKHEYKFNEIKGIIKNNDSITLFVADKKVHIESMAVLSDRLVDLINASLNPTTKAPEDDLLYKTWVAACEKIGNDDANIEKLNKYERIVFIAQLLISEVGNGGFSQFFFNSSGDFTNELVSSFEAIGANEAANVCDKAIKLFEKDIPCDWEERQEFLEVYLDDELDEALSKCDDEMYSCEAETIDRLFEYVMENREYFENV